MRIVIMGPPGSGKGTRAHIISDIYNIPVVTTGDRLREAVRDETEFGNIAQSYMEKGDLVPDNIVNGIVKERMKKADVKEGFILDGFPRSKVQADALDDILEELGIELTHVLLVVLSDEVIIERLSQRRSCPECGAVFHLKSAPPKKKGLCDVCGANLIQRNDDKKEVIQHRLEVYRKQTEPLLTRYKDRNLVVETSGKVLIEDLKTHLQALLG
jgi:adenylate kinase